MTSLKQIEKEEQLIARCEQSLALEKLKKRRADTRRKIEFGGLVIKSGMHAYSKAVILGALEQIALDNQYIKFFESVGNNSFLNTE